ncbi:dihydrolipoyl dehydrogenase [Mycoplasmopsis felis]|uniref:dihydrolipoyl dehydrogenase n=1 Tax=Mycoplasmopsis felis TaxID=33923 RepID=UPI003A4D4424
MRKEDKIYDVIIIGAGPGGYTLAGILSNNNLKVAIIEKDDLGGTCVNRGCISTKTLLKSTKVIETVKNSDKFGILSQYNGFDFNKIQERRIQNKELLNNAIHNHLTNSGVEIIKGIANVIDDNTVSVNDENIKFKNLVIATGSKNNELDVPGSKEGYLSNYLIDSDSGLTLNEVPKKLTIIGDGPISLEFANFYSNLDSEVTIITNKSFMSNFDETLSTKVKEYLTNKKIKIIENSKILRVNQHSINILTDQELEIFSDKVLVAIGRSANISCINELDIELNEKNFIKVNSQMKTNLDNIYALGDVTGIMQLSSVAYKTADIIARNILNTKYQELLNTNLVPWSIYLNPEIAGVGKNANQLKEENIELNEILLSSKSLPRAHAEGFANDLYFIKFLVSKEDDQILGCFIFLEGASILINQIAFAMYHNITFSDLQKSIYTHPTIAEALYYTSRNQVFKK